MPNITREELKRLHHEVWPNIGREGIAAEGTDIEGLVSTMVNCASILADYMLAREKATSKNQAVDGFLHGADDSWFDYIPGGLDVVEEVIRIWHEQEEPADDREFNPELGKEIHEIYFQDCVPEEAIPSLVEVFKKSGYNLDAYLEDLESDREDE